MLKKISLVLTLTYLASSALAAEPVFQLDCTHTSVRKFKSTGELSPQKESLLAEFQRAGANNVVTGSVAVSYESSKGLVRHENSIWMVGRLSEITAKESIKSALQELESAQSPEDETAKENQAAEESSRQAILKDPAAYLVLNGETYSASGGVRIFIPKALVKSAADEKSQIVYVTRPDDDDGGDYNYSVGNCSFAAVR